MPSPSFKSRSNQEGEGLEATRARVLAREVGDDVLAPYVANLNRAVKRRRALDRLGEGFAARAAHYVFDIVLGGATSRVARPIGSAAYRALSSRARRRSDALDAGAQLLGLLTTEGPATKS